MPLAVLQKKLANIDESHYDEILAFLESIEQKNPKASSEIEGLLNVASEQVAFGIASEYANPDLIPLEKEAMEKGFVGRYANID